MPRPPATTDEALLGDRVDPAASFDRFYRRHFPALLRFAASRGLSADDAADVVAETFLAALRQRHGYAAQYPTARPWLFMIARNKIADCQRESFGERRREEALRGFAIELTERDRRSYEALPAFVDDGAELLLGDLPAQQRAVIERRVLRDQEYAEIAAELGLTEPAARKHASRGLSTLRARIGSPRRDVP